MPTIDQLAPATSSSDGDEFIVSQGGITRKVTRAQILNGVQPQIVGSPGTLLGTTASNTANLAAIAIGANLVLNGSTLSAVAAPFSLPALPSGLVPQSTDLVAMAQGGTNVAVSYQQFLSGMSDSGIDVSNATVLLAGEASAVPLATLMANLLSVEGGTLTGPLTLNSAPTVPNQAATKSYVDQQVRTALPVTGGSLSGTLTLAGAPQVPLDAATKSYVDSASAGHLAMAGGSLTGALSLAGDPSLALQAATKQYADQKISRAGDTMSGPLMLSGTPVVPGQAATKAYVDATLTSSVPLAGGTMMGSLYLASDPTLSAQAATKQYVDQRVLRGGDSLTGMLSLAGTPTQSLHAATKNYVDVKVGLVAALGGATMSGALLLASDPAVPLQATTKQYADLKVSRNGDTLTGALFLNAAPTATLQAATKGYVDYAVQNSSFQGGGSFGGAVYLAADPVVPLQAVTKQYADARVVRTGDTLTGPLLLAADPTVALHAATKHYVDMQTALTLPLGGGSLAGSLYLSGDPTSVTQAATKRYVDGSIATALPVSGGSLTGMLSLASAPTAMLHAATKQYVDARTATAFALSGGTLAGALTLSGVPSAPLQAATKSYVDANPTAEKVINICLPPYSAKLDGVTDDTAAFSAAYQAASANSVIYVPSGTTVVQQPGTWGVALTKRVKWVVNGTTLADGTPLAAAISSVGPAPFVLPGVVVGHSPLSLTTSQGASQASDFAVQQSSYIVNHTGGTAGTVIANMRSDTIIYNSPANYVWNGLDRLLWAGQQTPNASTPAQHVGRYIQTIRQAATVNAQGQALPQPQLWAACLEYRDTTAQPSSNTNASLTVEMDWYGNGHDDANTRAIQSLVIGQHNTSGSAVEVANIIGVWLASGSSGSAKTVLNVNIPFSSSVLDTTAAQSVGGAPAIRIASGQAIAFDASNNNRLAYDASTSTLRWNQGTLSFPVGKGISVGWQDVYNASATLPNYVAGNMIFLVGTSPYSITLPAASSVAAGTGFTFSVEGTAPVSLITNGQDTIESGPIVLHQNDRYHIVSDGTGAWHEIFWTNAVSPRFLGPIVLPSYAVTALPSGVSPGAKAFASNGRKPSEAVGTGTGVEVFYDGQHWISSCSGTTVAA